MIVDPIFRGILQKEQTANEENVTDGNFLGHGEKAATILSGERTPSAQHPPPRSWGAQRAPGGKNAFCWDPREDLGRIRVIQGEWEVTDGPLCLLAPGSWCLSPFPLSALGAGGVLIS